MKIFVGIVLILFFVSCITKNQGSIVKVINDREAEVMVDNDFIKEGDKVYFLKTECNFKKKSHHKKKLNYRSCFNKKIGEGVVIERIGDIAKVKSNLPIELNEDYFVNWVYPE